MKVNKKKALIAGLGISLSLAVLFGVYSVIAYATPVSTRDVSYTTAYSEGGSLRHYALFSNETVYQNGTSLKYYPSGITDVIRGEYRYSTSPGASGSYKIEMHSNYYVSVNRKPVYLLNRTTEIASGNFAGSFSVPVKFNMTSLGEELKKIREGTDLHRAENEVYLTVTVSINGREPFTQKIQLKKDTSGMLSLDGATKDYQKVERNVSITENSVGFVGTSVKDSTARKVFPAMALLFAVPPLGFVYSKREKKPKDELASLRKYVVEGKSPEGTRKVELKTPEDLKRVFELVDRPIVHDGSNEGDVYSIADGDTVYEYQQL
ncbi:hypothetical protein, conserved [Thermococcus kodakarensis KOD1]|uniref:Uncharacterized protein n=1 Tax=Thermococcus kodakarensis (strain ATCC BAA-918 / JCM 12380 / KOD1) TaxID=69014 RepID=Q5JJ12_THEKO|nr:DUF5305 family protein [Thermococcus kodakarensis]WCN27621.1 DUF5305 family protein [Thermococcus kodakarensis]WCN29912.1 DUF5305 family protein [Thermococcus kodakarensis]BAD85890.1 hypothetical protein, conserved [Thermococcus kodakarensis KOD1]